MHACCTYLQTCLWGAVTIAAACISIISLLSFFNSPRGCAIPFSSLSTHTPKHAWQKLYVNWGPHSLHFLSPVCGSIFSFKGKHLHAWTLQIHGRPDQDWCYLMFLGNFSCIDLLPKQQQMVSKLLKRGLRLWQGRGWDPLQRSFPQLKWSWKHDEPKL